MKQPVSKPAPQATPTLKSTIKVALELDGAERQILKNLKVKKDSDGNLLLAPLLANICEIGDFDFSDKIVKYFSETDKELVFAGKYPLSEDTFVEK